MPFFQKFHYFLVFYLGFLSVLNIFCKFLTKALCSLSILLVFLESHLQAPLENDSFNWRLSLFWQEYLVSTQHSLCQHIQHHVNQSHYLLQQRVLWPLSFTIRLLTFITLLCSSTISPHKAFQVSHFLSFCVLGNSTDMNKLSILTSNSPIIAMPVWVNMDQLLWWLTSNSIYKERDALLGGVGLARH